MPQLTSIRPTPKTTWTLVLALAGGIHDRAGHARRHHPSTAHSSPSNRSNSDGGQSCNPDDQKPGGGGPLLGSDDVGGLVELWAEYRRHREAGVMLAVRRDLRFATCGSRHAADPTSSSPSAWMPCFSSGAGTWTRRRRPVPRPAFVARDVSWPKSPTALLVANSATLPRRAKAGQRSATSLLLASSLGRQLDRALQGGREEQSDRRRMRAFRALVDTNVEGGWM